MIAPAQNLSMGCCRGGAVHGGLCPPQRGSKSAASCAWGLTSEYWLIPAKIRKRMSNIIGRRPMTDKKTRMNGETPKLESGCLILPRSAAWLDDLLVEYLAFPNGKYDDQIDALSQFLNWRTTAETRTTFSFDFGHEDPRPQAGTHRASAHR